MRITTFNICGIKTLPARASWSPEPTYASLISALNSDIICFQETKIQYADITKEMAILKTHNAFFSCSTMKRGYAGVCVYVKKDLKVLHAEEGLTGYLKTKSFKLYKDLNHFPLSLYPEIDEQTALSLDSQGRALTLDFGAFVLINVYCPANSLGNMQELRDSFFELLDWRIHQLRLLNREVVLAGDLNVCREVIDSYFVYQDLKLNNLDFTAEEYKQMGVPRTAVNGWVDCEQMRDVVRDFNVSNTSLYTCWDISKNMRASNCGSRIDYILSTIKCTNANVMAHLNGSDHCPVYADFDIELEKGGKLPLLGRALQNRWPREISSFFRS